MNVKIFRLVAFVEGISLLVLLALMPIKRWFNLPQPTFYVGWLHGVLTVFYILFLIQVTIEKEWNWKKFAIAFFASLIPFGTFYSDKYLFKTAVKND
jgi:integral membrane protein